MDRDTFLGGSPLGVLIRLVLLSIVVGVVLSALGITPDNFFYQINCCCSGSTTWASAPSSRSSEYLVLGAMVVVPIWLIARLIKSARRGDETPSASSA